MQRDNGPTAIQGSTGTSTDTARRRTDTGRTEQLLYGDITRSIIAAFYAVYDALGYGFLESVYCAALEHELRKRGHKVVRELAVPVFYDGVRVGRFRLDLVVDDCVVVESKATEVLNPSHRRQLLNGLKATPLEVGLLLHFGPKPKFYRFFASNELLRR